MTELQKLLVAAFANKPYTSAEGNFSAEDVNTAAVNKLMETLGLTKDSTARDYRKVEDAAFALIEEAVDEILPKKLEAVLNEYAEVKSFARAAAFKSARRLAGIRQRLVAGQKERPCPPDDTARPADFFAPPSLRHARRL